MLGHRELSMEDYVGILKRRFRLILTCAILMLGIGFGLSFVLPPQYVSQTLVLVEQQKVPEDYVKPVVTEDLSARLASMKEQILSRSRLEPIIAKFNLFSAARNTMDDRIELTQKAIGVQPIPGGGLAHGMPGFYVTFKAQDAHIAQQVCGEITSLFVSENLNAREQSATGTTDFLKQQLADAKRNLDEQDAKLAAFQQKYIGKLPGTEAASANTLQALTSQLDATTQALNRLQQDETFLQAMVSQQSQQVQQVQGVETGSSVSVDEREKELKTLKDQKRTLEATYTPDYPDVVGVSRRIAEIEAEIVKTPPAPAPAAAKAPVPDITVANRHDSPELIQLKFKLRAAQQAIESNKQEQARISKMIRVYEEKVESSPIVEEENKQLTRDHDMAVGFYNSLLGKMNESSMATALEQRQQGEQFTVMDAPNLPDAPTFPNRYLFAGGGFGGGLFLGLLITGLLEYRDTAIRNEGDIWAFTKLPTLAVISHVEDLAQRAKESRRRRLFSRSDEPLGSAGS